MAGKYVVGIDLGTTNSVVAYAPLEGDGFDAQLLPIPQLVDHSTVESRTSLPSFLYLASTEEIENQVLDLPWKAGQTFAVGEFARRRAAEAPQRVVSAAKSWLCHHRVDRHEHILPWNADRSIPKVSPVQATQRYLEHLVAAWQHHLPDAPLHEQFVVLTVPASFDPSARDLTREAALAAGLPKDFLLLEEPQAALYCWLAQEEDHWRERVKKDDTLLVIDVGGGTTDLTLIAVDEQDGELQLRRVAVGDHLLVGGDNMDLALAHHSAGRFAEKKVKLNPWQSVSLWHSCRAAKETLLADDGPDKHTISVLGRGSKLIGGTVSVDLASTDVSELLVDGFFPECDINSEPVQQPQSGFQEIGLPFESDTAITKHLAKFLRQHEHADAESLPTHILFNGGVFKSPALRTRSLSVLQGWGESSSVTAGLEGNTELDNAVSQGAAYYGWSKHRGGIRIRGGTARSYYVGIESAGLAIPGVPRPLQALCVVPFGMEEGTEVDVASADVGVVVGQESQFRFFCSSVRKDDKPGDVIHQWTDDELNETDALATTLQLDEPSDDSYVPVRFQSRVTELGVFELWCVGTSVDQQWKLEFNVRSEN